MSEYPEHDKLQAIKEKSQVTTIQEFLKIQAEFFSNQNIKTLADVILTHGQEYESKPLPEGFEYGRSKECYANVFREITSRRLLRDASYAYCEGYAWTPRLIPCEHAWILDRTDGKVIDITWRDGGKTCGFCLGSGVEEDEDEDSETYGEESECFWCKGKGEQEDEHPSRKGTQYFGIEFDIKYVIKTTFAQGHYGILETYAQECLSNA